MPEHSVLVDDLRSPPGSARLALFYHRPDWFGIRGFGAMVGRRLMALFPLGTWTEVAYRVSCHWFVFVSGIDSRPIQPV